MNEIVSRSINLHIWTDQGHHPGHVWCNIWRHKKDGTVTCHSYAPSEHSIERLTDIAYLYMRTIPASTSGMIGWAARADGRIERKTQ